MQSCLPECQTDKNNLKVWTEVLLKHVLYMNSSNDNLEVSVFSVFIYNFHLLCTSSNDDGY